MHPGSMWIHFPHFGSGLFTFNVHSSIPSKAIAAWGVGIGNPCSACTCSLVPCSALRIGGLSRKGSISEIGGDIPGDGQQLLPGEGATLNLRTVAGKRSSFYLLCSNNSRAMCGFACGDNSQTGDWIPMVSLSTDKQVFLPDSICLILLINLGLFWLY